MSGFGMPFVHCGAQITDFAEAVTSKLRRCWPLRTKGLQKRIPAKLPPHNWKASNDSKRRTCRICSCFKAACRATASIPSAHLDLILKAKVGSLSTFPNLPKSPWKPVPWLLLHCEKGWPRCWLYQALAWELNLPIVAQTERRRWLQTDRLPHGCPPRWAAK